MYPFDNTENRRSEINNRQVVQIQTDKTTASNLPVFTVRFVNRREVSFEIGISIFDRALRSKVLEEALL